MGLQRVLRLRAVLRCGESTLELLHIHPPPPSPLFVYFPTVPRRHHAIKSTKHIKNTCQTHHRHEKANDPDLVELKKKEPPAEVEREEEDEEFDPFNYHIDEEEAHPHTHTPTPMPPLEPRRPVVTPVVPAPCPVSRTLSRRWIRNRQSISRSSSN